MQLYMIFDEALDLQCVEMASQPSLMSSMIEGNDVTTICDDVTTICDDVKVADLKKPMENVEYFCSSYCGRTLVAAAAMKPMASNFAKLDKFERGVCADYLVTDINKKTKTGQNRARDWKEREKPKTKTFYKVGQS
ncbi:hypothetical protein Tco_0435988 [Tanacetum coccineum]